MVANETIRCGGNFNNGTPSGAQFGGHAVVTTRRGKIGELTARQGPLTTNAKGFSLTTRSAGSVVNREARKFPRF